MIKVDRDIDQWNKIENLKIAPHNYSQFIFDKDAKHINRGRMVFSINGA